MRKYRYGKPKAEIVGCVARIPITNGKFVLVDATDAARVCEHNWCLDYGRRKSTEYAAATIRRKRTRLHRFITGASGDVRIDHANGNGLDNRRSNLRVACPSQNAANQVRKRPSRAGYKGVTEWDGSYHAGIMVNYKRIALGKFDNPIEAAKAYDRAARFHFGEFAKPNFPAAAV